jgi:hypothetical protein
MTAEFGIGNAVDVSYLPAAQVSCLVHFLLASKEVGLEANAKKIEFTFRLGKEVGCCGDGDELTVSIKCRQFVDWLRTGC